MGKLSEFMIKLQIKNLQATFSNYQNYFSKGLLGLSFLWTVFLFSGYVDNEYLSLPKAEQTELFESSKKLKSIAFFQKVIDFQPLFKFDKNYSTNFKYAIFVYNSKYQVKFLQLNKRSYSYDFWTPNLPNKTFPKSTDGDSPFFLIG